MELRNLLKNEIDVNDIQYKFDEIAKALFLNYQITRGNTVYEFLEIEFYYYKANHEDIITYPRNLDAGMWFFHSSGVDITFESKCNNIEEKSSLRKAGNDFFGGILIRSLLKKDTNELICGPMKCTEELFDKFDAFEAKKEEFPILSKKEKSEQKDIFKTERFINIKEESKKSRFENNCSLFDKYHKEPYRYFVKLGDKCDASKISKYTAKPWKDENYKNKVK